MRKALYAVIFIITGTVAHAGNITAKTDSTGDSWSLTYNCKEILAYKVNGNNNYLIDSIADNASITIDYYTDKPCPKCQSRLQFRDENGKILATVQKEGFGEGEPFRLPGKQFRQLMRNHKMYLFFSANPDGWGGWIMLGIVKTNR